MNLARDVTITTELGLLYPEARSFSEQVFCAINDIECAPKCLCGKIAAFQSFNYGYRQYCSTSCANKANAIQQSNTKKSWEEERWNHIQSKTQSTNIERYGVPIASQSPLVKERIKSTCLERYNVEYASQSQIKKQKTITTNIQKYGVANPSQRHLSELTIQCLSSKEWLQHQHHALKKNLSTIAWELNVDRTSIQARFEEFEIERIVTSETQPEVLIRQVLEEAGVKFIQNDRSQLDGKELDFWIPSLRLGIEYNGLFYHSFDHVPTTEEKYKHRKKYEMCRDRNIELIQLTGEKWNVIQTFIRNKVSSIERVYARKCSVQEIDSSSFDEQMNRYHIQGTRKCKVKLGLFHEGQLLGCIGFNKISEGWELSRLVFGDVRVVGGASKLLKAFISSYDPSRIVSYSSNAYSSGNVYKQLGFTQFSETRCDLWYVLKGQLINRHRLMKHKLNTIIEGFDPNLTEQQNLLNNKYRVYYGPGTKGWVLNLEK